VWKVWTWLLLNGARVGGLPAVPAVVDDGAGVVGVRGVARELFIASQAIVKSVQINRGAFFAFGKVNYKSMISNNCMIINIF